MLSLLSTKKLAQNQKELLLNSGIAFVEYDAIKIEILDFEISGNLENAIFSSKNAVKAILKKNLKIENCWCVGKKTAKLLKEHNYGISGVADSAEELAELIVENNRELDFTFFCGSIRREELPKKLKNNSVNFKEIEVYQTRLNPQEFKRKFDGILFFSPSAVESYFEKNPKTDTVAFCIGETTAKEAQKHSKNIVVANSPGVENVIAKAVQHFRNIDIPK